MEIKLKKKFNQKQRNHKINNEISAEKVRVIDPVTKTNEVLPIREAIIRSQQAEVDLVQITNDEIPICKLIEYSKFTFQQDKAKKEKKQTTKKLKQVKFHPTIGENDLTWKCNHIAEFINDGHQVQIICQFKGRENSHKEFGFSLFEKIKEHLSSVARVDGTIATEGNSIKMMLVRNSS